ncbi:MAG TPA: hypothetical protein VGM90_14235 [Kofleriaceae bacterium]
MRASSFIFASVLAASLFGRSARAESCPVTAVLEGDGALVDSLDTTLGKRGVSTTASENCPATHARIDRKGAGIAISLVDPAGRRSERTIADVDAAASVIESWARQDVNEASLLGWTIDPVAAPSEPSGPVDSLVAHAPARELAHDPLMVAAMGEGSMDFGGAAWYGGVAAVCVRVGPMCLGARGRAATTSDRRANYDVLAAADVVAPLSRNVAFVAGAGGGVGRYSAPYQQGDDAMRAQTDRLRIDAHIGFTFQLARHISLDLGIAAGLTPTAKPITVVTAGTGGDSNPGDGGVGGPGGDTPPDGDPPPSAPPTTRDLLEPLGYVRAGIGLRIGAP